MAIGKGRALVVVWQDVEEGERRMMRTIVRAVPVVDDSDALALLREIRDELRLLNAATRPTVHHGEASAELLRAIHGAIADRVFSAGDLLIHAALPVAADLHAAIVAAIGIANARRIGKALAQAEGRNLGGLCVIRVASDSTGILWSVRRV